MWSIKMRYFFIGALFLCAGIFAVPIDWLEGLVVTSTKPTIVKESEKENPSSDFALTVPQIYQIHVKSNVSNRFAHTTIISKVKNIAQKSQEATFSIDLSEAAFISGFIMEVGEKNYTAYVEEREKANKYYAQAVASGLGAAHVSFSARDFNRIIVSVNIEPETKVAFYLTYEELLKRVDGHYEQVINLYPGQLVQDLSVEILIAESRKIVDLKAPPIRSSIEFGDNKPNLDPRADIEIINDKSAIVRFCPNLERQKQLAYLHGKKKEEGLGGQFVVQYDVERDSNGGEVLIQDGYFVHFFAPTELVPLSKHVVFVFDTSSSMRKQKLQQLKQAMHRILGQLHNNDLFSLVEFNINVKVWDLNDDAASVWYPSRNKNFRYSDRGDEIGFDDFTFPCASSANRDNIKKARNIVSQLDTTPGTDIHTALKVALHLVELAKTHKIDEVDRQPLIVFLTDGEPTIRLISTEEITSAISEFNVGLRRSPIFVLSFGLFADTNFLQKLALRNFGFSKHVYLFADAALQTESFYRKISSPLLTNVTFKYEPSVTSLTKTEFPIHFEKSEIVVTGWCDADVVKPVISGWGVKGKASLQPAESERSVTNVERLWAYKTIKQYLEKKEVADGKRRQELKKKALDLALKYSFVTPLSSLVVFKPNDVSVVDIGRPAQGSNLSDILPSYISERGSGVGFATVKQNLYRPNFCKHTLAPFAIPKPYTTTPQAFTTLRTYATIQKAATTVSAVPSDWLEGLVVTSTKPTIVKESEKENPSSDFALTVPQIYQIHVKSNVSNRFAHTTIISKVRNIAQKSQEATFSIDLPEAAFISGLIMEVGEKNYTAYVAEKAKAKSSYDKAVASGLGAAHVTFTARDFNRFTVSVNIEPETKAAFYLTYEELLKRVDGHYEQVIDLYPGQLVQDLSVEILIAESRKIVDLKTLPFRSYYGEDLDPKADIEIINDKSAIVKFSPNLERQKQLAYLHGNKKEEGLGGQFVVQYDVERDPNGGEVLIQDGYFVHFFAPNELIPLPKHVVFVFDTSSSMRRQKLQQLKQAMHKILGQLHNNDLFSLVEFNINVKVWDLNDDAASVWYPSRNINFRYRDRGDEISFDNFTFPRASCVNPDNIKKARHTVSQLATADGTDIHTALRVALHLVESAKTHKIDEVVRQPLIVFLTDGEPTIRLISTEEITRAISEFNVGLRRSPIFILSFGILVYTFLQKLALRNFGFSKHIYFLSDAALQTESFYRQISSPLLANVTFKYERSVASLTKTEFPIHFEKSEIVVTGWCGVDDVNPVISGWGVKGKVSLEPAQSGRSLSNLERLWAYKTIKEYLEKKEVANDKRRQELKKKALELALKYSFVTPLSSLVVVKPNDVSAVDVETVEQFSDLPDKLLSAYVSGRGSGFGFAAVQQNLDRPQVYKYTLLPYRPYRPYPTLQPFPQYQFTLLTYLNRQAIPANHRIPISEITTPIYIPHIQDPPSIYDRVRPNQTHIIIQTTPRVYFTTRKTYTTTQKAATTVSADLLTISHWLKDVLSDNGILNLPLGKYKLGLNETIVDKVDCPKTPLNATGHCSLLHSCPQVHSLVRTFDEFVQHFCVLKNEYAGICCPNHS